MHPPGLKPSPLRPDCSAPGRILLWRPEHSRNVLDPEGHPTNLSDDDLLRINEVMGEAYAPSTKRTYSTGLAAFHVFCDTRDIEERHRAPIDETVLASFISTIAGLCVGSTIKNFVFGIHAWHLFHGVQWRIDDAQLKTLLPAGRKMSPVESKEKEKEPWPVGHLAKICDLLNPNGPKDAAVHACLTTAFLGTARLGKVTTVPRLDAFDPKIHVKVSDVQHGVKDRNDLEETDIFIPWTKSAREKGEKIFWAKQDGIVDHEAALANHLKVNDPPNEVLKYEFTLLYCCLYLSAIRSTYTLLVPAFRLSSVLLFI